MLDKIRIVLISTSHPGNIGSSARAMMTMGLSELCLVAPLSFPHDKAIEMASGATEILANASIVETLDEAINDCTLVIGMSARDRAIPWPLFTPREMAQKVIGESKAPHSQIAILFGREQNGLTNDELQRCHAHVQIPANPIYSSLNLAAAVQVMAYELRMADLGEITFADEWDYRLATADEMEKFFIHLQEVLVQIEFLKLSAPRRLMTRMRRLFFRTRPDAMEMNMLRGMLTAIQETIRK
jgi:tRNA (cytidine32/uridine32-2'-O)-methyltransferase